MVDHEPHGGRVETAAELPVRLGQNAGPQGAAGDTRFQRLLEIGVGIEIEPAPHSGQEIDDLTQGQTVGRKRFGAGPDQVV